MTAAALETAPVALVAGLAAWAFWDFLGIPVDVLTRGFVAVLLVGLAALLLGLRFAVAALRRLGLLLVAVSYLGAHLFALPLDSAAALGFLTLVLVAVELRILAERFAPVFRADLGAEVRDRVRQAFARSVLRIAAAAAIGFMGSTLTADLALSGALPLRSIASALFLSMALIAVVLLLAFWPSVDRRLARARSPVETIQTAK